MQPIPPSRGSLPPLYPPPNAVSKHSQAQPDLKSKKPSSHNQLQPLVVVLTITSPIFFKQPWSPPAVPHNIQPSHNIPVPNTPQQPSQQPKPVPGPLQSSGVNKLFKYLRQPMSTQQLPSLQVIEHSPQSHQPKYPPSDYPQQSINKLPPLPKSSPPAPHSQQNADQLQKVSQHQLPKLYNKPSPQQLPHDHQSSPELSHQPSRQSSGSNSPHDQSPPPSPREPVPPSPPPPPNPPPSLTQSPQLTRYFSADVLKQLMTKHNFNILLFRITTYLGFIFDGKEDRKHNIGQSLATYRNQKHGATLQITDTFGPEIGENNDGSLPDLILMCLPLHSDVDIRRREKKTLQVMKRSYKNCDIWLRVVIVLTVPKKYEPAAILNRQDDIKASIKECRIQTMHMPPIICISENFIKDMLSDSKPKWYTELWSAIFKHCSENGCPTLHLHLTDRLTDISAKTRSSLPKIPKESIKILEKRIEEYQNAKDMTQKVLAQLATHQSSHQQPLWTN